MLQDDGEALKTCLKESAVRMRKVASLLPPQVEIKVSGGLFGRDDLALTGQVKKVALVTNFLAHHVVTAHSDADIIQFLKMHASQHLDLAEKF